MITIDRVMHYLAFWTPIWVVAAVLGGVVGLFTAQPDPRRWFIWYRSGWKRGSR